MVIHFLEGINNRELQSDELLNAKESDGGFWVSFKDQEERLFFYTEEEYNPDFTFACNVGEGALPLLKYVVEKHKLLVCADGAFADAANTYYTYFSSGDDFDFGEAVWSDYATHEMLAFAKEYGWSEEFLAQIKEWRKECRAQLGMKDSYEVGETVLFNYCEEDEYFLTKSGKVIYVDDLHAIAQVSEYTLQLIAGLNREGIPHEEVERIVGRPIDTILHQPFDKFINLYDPSSYLAKDPFCRCEWLSPFNVSTEAEI